MSGSARNTRGGQRPGAERKEAIDDLSRELHAPIMPEKTLDSATRFLTETVNAQCPYQIDYAYSDNGKEYTGTDQHAFVKACLQQMTVYTKILTPSNHLPDVASGRAIIRGGPLSDGKWCNAFGVR